MKTIKLFLAAVVIVFATSATLNAQDVTKTETKKTETTKKDDKKNKSEVVTFNVSMDCHGCQQKIEKNIPWEKGVKDLKVDLEAKTVKITYDPKKTTEDKLKEAIEKLNFTCQKPESKDEQK